MRPRLLLEQPPGLGKGHAAGIAHEQLYAQLLLQIGQRFADGLLADIAHLCRTAEAFLLADGQKELKLLILHGPRPSHN